MLRGKNELRTTPRFQVWVTAWVMSLVYGVQLSHDAGAGGG